MKKEDVKGAYAVFDEMKANGVRPDEVTFNLLIDLLVKVNVIQEAKTIFNSTLSIENRINGNSLDVHGLSQGAAFVALSLFIESYWKQDSFILITGKGLHSKNRDPYEMREFMQEKIKNNFAQLTSEVDVSNPGRLIIKKKMDD